MNLNIYLFVAELWLLQMITLIVLNKAIRDAAKTIGKTVISKVKKSEEGETVSYLTPEEEVIIDERERRSKGIY